MKYLDDLLNEIIRTTMDKDQKSSTQLSLFDLFKIAAEEIGKLEVNNFSPETRYRFLITRQHFRKLGAMGTYSSAQHNQFIELAKKMLELLKSYDLMGFPLTKRSFIFIHDKELQVIIKRDYAELTNVLLPDGAWKSVVVMAGSILEAILFDMLSSQKHHRKAMTSSKAPKDNSGNILDIKTKDWKLITLIDVATDIGIIPKQRAEAVDQILRDFRNFIHPRKEIRSQFPCGEAEALLAKGALDAICNHLEKIA